MFEKNTHAVVLAAGRSTRFSRKKSKLLSKICGQAMILFPLKVLEKLKIKTTVVLGYHSDKMKKEIENSEINNSEIKNIDYVLQKEMLGTGDAVLRAQTSWGKDSTNLGSQNILILNADVPLVKSELIKDLLEKHEQNDATLSFVSTRLIKPKGYGRVVEKDGIIQIYEEKNCPEKYKSENRVNAGIYVIKKDFLQDYISKIEKNSSGEFYLTDLVLFASQSGEKVQVVPAPFDSVRGVNTLKELWAVEQVMRSNLIEYWMERGVRFELAQSTHVDINVEIGQDSFIGTGVHLLGKTKIGEDCFVSAFSIIENTVIGDGTKIHSHSVIQESRIGCNVQVGPFARLRNNVVVCDNVAIGNFVEVKNSTLGENTKTKHLCYIGDADIGKSVNIGAGTMFCNYNGFKKSKTVIEDNVFVGSNNTLIAPIKIMKNSYVAAGSTITKDVESEDLAIARVRQENKPGYAKKLKER